MANQIQVQDRTLDKFKTALRGGGVRSNLFECEINFPAGVQASADIAEATRFLVKTAALPGSTVGMIPVPFRGRTLKVAGDRAFDSWTITVINDQTFGIRNAFEKWLSLINGHNTLNGLVDPAAYQVEMKITQLGKAPSANGAVPALKSYKLWGVWPTMVDPIPVSYDAQDSIQEFNVQLEMQYWEALDPNDTVIVS